MREMCILLPNVLTYSSSRLLLLLNNNASKTLYMYEMMCKDHDMFLTGIQFDSKA